MLSVAPMNLARAAYHEQSLGHGLDDYYSEWGERPGIWWGGGAELLGLEGYAAPGSIVSLIEGRDPASGELLRRPTSSALVTRRVFDPASGGVVERQVEQKRVGGWDFAFSAPKSISLALTFGDTETRRECSPRTARPSRRRSCCSSPRPCACASAPKARSGTRRTACWRS